jgi:predicted permease
MSLSLVSPMSGDGWNVDVYIAGRPDSPVNSENTYSWNRVGPRFFTTMGTRILQGRAIDERDTASSPHVAMVTEAFAKHFFPHENPIGKHFGKFSASHAGDYEIVGVTEDTRYASWDMNKPPAPVCFVPITQRTVYGNRGSDSMEMRMQYSYFITLRLAPGVRSVETQVRQVLKEINPDLPILTMQSLADQVKENFTQQELIARLTSLFGGLALVLATVGLYGVTAYGVARRTGEIGVRMALGASRGRVMALVMRRALVLAGIGLLFGLPLTVAAGYLIRNQLYGVSGGDPLTLASAVIILALSSALASVLPARRAASIAPMSALRVE